MKYELMARYDSRASFHHKAIVEEENGVKTLYSYETPVAEIDKNNKVKLLNAWDYSQTTLRHTKEFLKQNGFEAESKNQMYKDYEIM